MTYRALGYLSGGSPDFQPRYMPAFLLPKIWLGKKARTARPAVSANNCWVFSIWNTKSQRLALLDIQLQWSSKSLFALEDTQEASLNTTEAVAVFEDGACPPIPKAPAGSSVDSGILKSMKQLLFFPWKFLALKKTLFHAMSQLVRKSSSGTIMRVLEFCEEKSFSYHTKNNGLAVSSCHVKICSSGSPNASDISMLSSGLKNVLTTSHPAVRELIQTPVVNKPSNQLRIQFLFSISRQLWISSQLQGSSTLP